MRPLVFSENSYVIAFGIAIAIWAVPERIFSFWMRSSRDPTAKREDHWSYLVLTGTIVVSWFLGIVLSLRWTAAAILWLRPQLAAAGIALILFGVGLRWWAMISLGHYFTLDVAVRPGQAVIESGPYRLIRHPSYSAMLLISVGAGLALGNWASLIVMPAGEVVGFLYRVRVEERALIDMLGPRYLDYMRRTKRFVPFVV